jgi:hypothetical protein
MIGDDVVRIPKLRAVQNVPNPVAQFLYTNVDMLRIGHPCTPSPLVGVPLVNSFFQKSDIVNSGLTWEIIA